MREGLEGHRAAFRLCRQSLGQFFALILRNLSLCLSRRGKNRLLPAFGIASYKAPVHVSLEDLSLAIKTCLGALLYMETAI